MRDKAATKMTSKYTRQEQRDLKSYPKMPSPRGSGWKQYIEHKIKMTCDSLATYARRKYAHLSLNKHIESHRESDMLAVHITHNKPTVVYMGDAIFPADSPIGIKKRKRCPGHRRLVTSLKKSGKTDVVFTPEPYTSQTCANCLRRFPKKTKSHRFKVCTGCIPHEAVNLPPKIITDRSRRRLQRDRKEIARNQPVQPVQPVATRAKLSERRREQRRIARSIKNPLQLDDTKAMKRHQRRERRRKRRKIAGRKVARHRRKKKWKPPIDEEPDEDNDEAEAEADAQPKPQPKPRRQIIDTGVGKLGSKRILFQKKWHSSPGVELDRAAACPVVWHRDIVAAKCILYVGKYESERNIHYFFGVFEFHFICFRPLSCIWIANSRIILSATRTEEAINSCEAAKTTVPKCSSVDLRISNEKKH